jgi:hypothetical protein
MEIDRSKGGNILPFFKYSMLCIEMNTVEQSVKEYLKKWDYNLLLLAYMMMQREEPAPKTVDDMKKKLLKIVPWAVTDKHLQYVRSLTPKERAALDDYKGNNYIKINAFMRSGKFRRTIMYFDYPDSLVTEHDLSKEGVKRYVKQERAVWLKQLIESVQKEREGLKTMKQSILDLNKVILRAPKLHQPFYAYRGEKDFDPKDFALLDPANPLAEIQTFRLQQQNLKVGDEFQNNGFNSFSISPTVPLHPAFHAPICCLYRIHLTDKVPFLLLPLEISTTMEQEFEVLLPPAKFKVVKITELVSPLSKITLNRMYDVEFVKALPIKFKTGAKTNVQPKKWMNRTVKSPK